MFWLLERLGRIWDTPVVVMVILFGLGSLFLDRKEMKRKGLQKEARLTTFLGIALIVVSIFGYVVLKLLTM